MARGAGDEQAAAGGQHLFYGRRAQGAGSVAADARPRRHRDERREFETQLEQGLEALTICASDLVTIANGAGWDWRQAERELRRRLVLAERYAPVIEDPAAIDLAGRRTRLARKRLEALRSLEPLLDERPSWKQGKLAFREALAELADPGTSFCGGMDHPLFAGEIPHPEAVRRRRRTAPRPSQPAPFYTPGR